MRELPELKIPQGCCKECPTLQGIQQGHDPESYQILTSETCFRSYDADPEFENLHCPWRDANCIAYAAEWKWARECWDKGVQPPVKLHPMFNEND